MKTVLLITLFFISTSIVYGLENCKEVKDINGKYYWYYSIVSETSVIGDGNEDRIWYVNTDPSLCYNSKQTEINSPGTIYTGYIMALRELGKNLNSDNRSKIKKITGINFKDTDQFNRWFDRNSNKFFWSFEKNKIVVLENGFRCKKITNSGGKLYWFNYSLGAVVDMDTSSDKRLWSDAVDKTKCFISPLEEINDQNVQLQGFRLALEHIGSGNDEIRQQLINRFKLLTSNNRLLMNELTK